MRRVPMNFQLYNGWVIHFIEADCRTTIGQRTRYIRFATEQEFRAFVSRCNLEDVTIFEQSMCAILVLPSDTAKQRFERIYSSGNPQAMSYALAGMRKLDRKRYSELIASARTSDAPVHTMSGCIMTNEKLRKIADELDSGKYDPWLR
jgi:hypothetical protein